MISRALRSSHQSYSRLFESKHTAYSSILLISRAFAYSSIKFTLTPSNSTYMGDNIVNFYSGQPPLNRLSFQRQSVEKITAHLESPATRFVVFRDGKPLVHSGEPGKLLLLTKADVAPLVSGGFVNPTPSDLESKDRAKLFESARLPHTQPTLVFLGVDDRSASSKPAVVDLLNPTGAPFFAVDATGAEWEVEGGEWGDARASGSALSSFEAGMFALSRALVDWNGRNKFCPACGSPTYSLWGGWKRNCTTAVNPVPGKEACFSTKGLHNFAYPRTDPVMIMGVLNSAGDKILLGRQKSWPQGRSGNIPQANKVIGMYSCLAGFVEPGESFEEALRREVLEEAGIEVGAVRYQPWPFPANLMIGCYGTARDGQTIRLDLDNELEDAQWFTRDQIIELIDSPTGSKFTKADYQKLEQKKTSDQETGAALAPADKTANELVKVQVEGVMKGQITRIPPETAIAGQLIRHWAVGGLDTVGKL